MPVLLTAFVVACAATGPAAAQISPTAQKMGRAAAQRRHRDDGERQTPPADEDHGLVRGR